MPVMAYLILLPTRGGREEDVLCLEMMVVASKMRLAKIGKKPR